MPTIIVPNTPQTKEVPEEDVQLAREIWDRFGGMLDHADEKWMQDIAAGVKRIAGVE